MSQRELSESLKFRQVKKLRLPGGDSGGHTNRKNVTRWLRLTYPVSK